MMLEQRANASSVILNQKNTLWVVGGKDKFKIHNTTEFVSFHQLSIEGPELPFTIHSHSVIQGGIHKLSRH